MGLPILNSYFYRGTEIFILIAYIGIQLVFHNERKQLGILTRNYVILQIVLFSMIGISFVDIVVELFRGAFPILNFVFRGFIIILLIRNLRIAWMNILLLLWRTKTVFFLLFCNIFIFGLLGSFLFKLPNEEGDFNGIIKSMYSLYILLSTCNFPDVMLGTFPISRFSVFFFAAYITINLFIIMSLLKALYYANYFDIYKGIAIELIEDIKKPDSDPENNGDRNSNNYTNTLTNNNNNINTYFEGNNTTSKFEESKPELTVLNKAREESKLAKEKIFSEQEFYSFLLKIKRQYSFAKEEYNKILEIVGISKQNKFHARLRKYNEEETLMRSNKIIIFLNKKWIEALINIFDLLLIYLLFRFTSGNIFINIIQIFWCSFFIFESFIYYSFLGFNRLIMTELVKCIFFLVNFLLVVCLIGWFTFYLMGKTEEYNILYDYTKLLIVLRAVRIFVLLNLFKEFQIIFITLHNMKGIFWGHLLNLFSLFFLFSTLSMLVTGGNIKLDSFYDKDNIPNNYYHINFNDFGSSFLSCFALMMINNVNIIAKSLSIGLNNETLYNSYFATFYFFSTLIILNICQTLLLEMYLTLKSKKLE